MTDKTRDDLLLAMAAVLLHLVDTGPEALCNIGMDRGILEAAIRKAVKEKKTKE